MALEEEYWISPSPRGNRSSWIMDTQLPKFSQFHMVYDDSYQQMATTPMIWSTWQEGQLVAKLNVTHTHFGLPPTNTPVKKPAECQQVPPVVIQRNQSHFQQVAPEDIAVPELTNQPPHPRTVEYLEPSFSLERPVCRLKMDERLEVHNNFISAVSNKILIRLQTAVLQDLRQTLGVAATLSEEAGKDLVLQVPLEFYVFP